MAVPKKRTGASAQGHRRSNWKATVPETTTCKNCGELALTHTVCTACGFYKGKAVSIKSEAYVEEVVEKPKKAAKKPAKKAETEAKAVKKETVKEEAVTEETKIEEEKSEESEEK